MKEFNNFNSSFKIPIAFSLETLRKELEQTNYANVSNFWTGFLNNVFASYNFTFKPRFANW
ncbi:hypothetical protein [Spiroplasma endosymbiont of Ammophila pubescens]|uniref:hypothetical protein n=1 Tax=Spiroplasma endosymbiont of Ammophila pubescens TaxID=3066315 RepID=UPI0032B1B0D4